MVLIQVPRWDWWECGHPRAGMDSVIVAFRVKARPEGRVPPAASRELLGIFPQIPRPQLSSGNLLGFPGTPSSPWQGLSGLWSGFVALLGPCPLLFRSCLHREGGNVEFKADLEFKSWQIRKREPLRNVDPAAPSCPQALLRGKMLHTDYLEFQWTKFLLFVAKKPKKKIKNPAFCCKSCQPRGVSQMHFSGKCSC